MQKSIKICVYGASVSEQAGESGYVNHLKKDLLQRVNCDFDISRIAFPSASFNDAGFCHVDYVVAQKANFVFFDWLTTTEIEFDFDKLKFFMTRLLRNSIYPIIVDFPRGDSLRPRRKNHFQAVEISQMLRVGYLDVTDYCLRNNLSALEVTRDGVHTNKFGAELYSRLLADYISVLIVEDTYLKRCYFDRAFESGFSILNSTISDDIIITSGEVFNFKLYQLSNNTSNFAEVWGMQIVGVFSPIIILECSDINFRQEIQIWDEWCHYNRLAFKNIVPRFSFEQLGRGELNFTIRLSDKKPNYSTCKREGISFTEPPSVRMVNNFFSINCLFSIN